MFSTYFEKQLSKLNVTCRLKHNKYCNHSFSLPVLFLICVICYFYIVNNLIAFEMRCLPSWQLISIFRKRKKYNDDTKWNKIRYGKLNFESHKQMPLARGAVDNFPADTWRNDYVKTMSRRHFDIVRALWLRRVRWVDESDRWSDTFKRWLI